MNLSVQFLFISRNVISCILWISITHFLLDNYYTPFKLVGYIVFLLSVHLSIRPIVLCNVLTFPNFLKSPCLIMIRTMSILIISFQIPCFKVRVIAGIQRSQCHLLNLCLLHISLMQQSLVITASPHPTTTYSWWPRYSRDNQQGNLLHEWGKCWASAVM